MVKHKPPSRVRYEEDNPNWTVRLTRPLFDALQTFLESSDFSRRDFIARALGEQEEDYEKAYSEGFTEGYDEGEEKGYETGSNDGYENGQDEGFAEGEEKSYNNGYKKGHLDGFEKGKKKGFDEGAEYIYNIMKYRDKIWYYCSVCQNPITIFPNSPEHHFIIDMMFQNNWRHYNCGYWEDSYRKI